MKLIPTRRHLLDAACVFGLVALGLIVWSVVDPRPVPVILAMSVGQGIGTLSFLAYIWLVIDDARRDALRHYGPHREHRDGERRQYDRRAEDRRKNPERRSSHPPKPASE